jgi:hypothetical protein
VKHLIFVGIAPAGEVLLGNTVNGLDAHLIDQRPCTFFNVKKCANKTTYTGHNHDNALHGFNLAKTFDGGLCFGSMGFRHVECPFVVNVLFRVTRGQELGCIILVYKGKNGDGVCFKQKGL